MRRCERRFRTSCIRATLGLIVLLCVCATSCEREPFEEGRTLGGVEISAEVLNRGYGVYQRYCVSCHGAEGNGAGKASRRMKVKPRDFRLGHFKFKAVVDEGLPTDEDLSRVVRRGLKGTEMMPVALPPEDLHAVIQYIKTFSDRWSEEEPGEAVKVPEDPWEDVKAAEVRGRVVYHGSEQCWRCHAAYAEREEIVEMVGEIAGERGERVPEKVVMRGDLKSSQALETVYGKQLPPDLVSDTFRGGYGDFALFRTLSAGVGGTRMKGLHGRYSPRDIWAVVHYVRGLQRHRANRM